MSENIREIKELWDRAYVAFDIAWEASTGKHFDRNTCDRLHEAFNTISEARYELERKFSNDSTEGNKTIKTHA